jgi:Tfp pilus assembly protein PilF
LYSNVNNEAEAVSTLSIKEMVGFIFIVGSSLYLLYPKGEIEKQLSKSIEENTQLSIDYLNSMLSQNPNSTDLGKKLIEKYRLNGEIDKALTLTREFIVKTKNTEELEALYKEEYLLLKEQYFKSKSKDKKAQLLELNEKLYHLFLYAKDVPDYQFLFHESTSMDFKELRYKSVNYLLTQEPVTLKLKEDALALFLSYKKMDEAEVLALELLEQESSREKRVEYFKTAFYILAQDIKKNQKKIEKLIDLYSKRGALTTSDLYLLSDASLQIGQKKEAANFLYENFKTKKELFDEKSTFETIRVLSYDSQLKEALEVSEYAYKEYPSTQSLDSTIQLSTWLSKIDRAVKLNEEGWRKYGDEKYERYLLEKTTFDGAYKIRGEIYKKEISAGNLSMVKRLGEYYEYTGEIDKAEAYFMALLLRHPKKSVYREAIRFAHNNGSYKKVESLYAQYRKKFGINREIHKLMIKEYLASKSLPKAYKFSKELEALGVDKKKSREREHKSGHGHSHGHAPKKENHLLMLKQMAWIEKDYIYLHKLLWKEEKLFTKHQNSYAQLIKLERKIEKSPRLEYLYKRAWELTNQREYATQLLSLYIKRKEYEQFGTVLHGLTSKDRMALDGLSSFQILLANYHQGVRAYDHALASFAKALQLDPKSSEVHQAYLWFLINNGYYSELKSEFHLIEKDKKLQQKIAFPSVVAALKLDKGDVAKKWLTPLLKKNKKSLEYQALYADILDFQGEKDQAKAIRFKLFRTMHREVASSKALLKDKEFAQLYLQMALSYKFPYSKKVHYMERFKSLFTKEEYLEIELGFYSSHKMVNKVSDLVDKHNLNYPWLNLYLATQRGDKEFAKKAYAQDQSGLSLKDRVSIAIDSNHRDNAYTLLFNGMRDNQNNISLATTYWQLINEEFPKSNFSISREHLSREVSLESMELTTKYALNSHLDIGVNLLQNRFILEKGDSFQERAFGVALGNHGSDFLWSFDLGRYFGDNDYYYSRLKLQYNFEQASVALDMGKNNRTVLTPKLQTYGLEDSVKLDLSYSLNRANQFGLSYQQSNYGMKDGTSIGSGKILQFSNTQLFRFGYPDVTLFNHVNIERFDFDNRNMGLSSFTEVGSELSIGTSVKNNLQKSWRPYMTLGMALNDHKQVGSSLTFGAAGSLYRADKLDFSLRYIKGVNNLNEEMYGAYLDYSY